MSNMVRNLVAIMAVICMVMGVFAIEADGGYGEGVDSGTPLLHAYVVGNVFTLENIGTAPAVDCGGAKIVANGETVGVLPYTTVLQPNPFIFTDVPMAPKWFQNVELSRPLVPGEKFVVTNGIGIYAKGVAA